MDKEDVVHIFNEIWLIHKGEWNNTICSNMGGDDPTKWSQKEKAKYHMTSLIYGIYNMYNEHACETEPQTQRSDLRLPRGTEEGGLGRWN